jgi:hypothetical protein
LSDGHRWWRHDVTERFAPGLEAEIGEVVMRKIGNVINMILLIAVLMLAGEWSFGLYGAVVGLVLGIAGDVAVLRLQRSIEDDRRFDPTRGNEA